MKHTTKSSAVHSLARRLPMLWAAASILLLPVGGAAAEQAHRRAVPTIVFMTDFGTLDDAVAICKGVMLGIAPDARIVDLTHQVTPYSIADGARYLLRTALYYPPGTIFIAVVDPGVGTARKALIVKSKRGQYFVVPDNGLLTLIEDRDGIEGAREITNPAWMLPGAVSSTFHGRDIFSPAAAHLARGDDWTTAGPALEKLTRLQLQSAVLSAQGIEGRIVALDGPFGNLISNVSGEQFRALGYTLHDKVRLRLADSPLQAPYVRTFGDVAVGEPLLFIDSSGLVSLAINQGNFAQVHHIVPPVAFFVAKK